MQAHESIVNELDDWNLIEAIFILVLVTAAAWLGWRNLRARWWQMILTQAVAACFAAGFLLNPICLVFGANAQAVEIIFVIAGIGWLWFSTRHTQPLRIRGYAPRASWAALSLVLVLIAYGRTWPADLAYRGDEVFHVVSVQMRWLMLQTLASQSTALVWLLIGLAVTVYAVRRVRQVWLSAVPLLVVAAICVPWLVPTSLLQHSYMRDRLLRYPALQSWISAFLGAVWVPNWGRVIFSTELSRLLPVLALTALAVLLIADPRLRRHSLLVAGAMVAVVLTIPNLMFHATILYLELPIVLALVIVLWDARRWLEEPYPRICARWSWWVIIIMGLLKETSVPILVTLLVLRLVVQWRQSGLKARNEILVWGSVLGPALLYLVLRQRDNIRPYGAAWSLLFESETWIRVGRALIAQNGVWSILALFGAVLLYKRGRWQVVAACLSVFIATTVFFLCDNKEAAGYARFDLLLLPPLIVLGWEGLLYFGRKNLWAGVGVCTLLIVANLSLSPVNLKGDRALWNGAPELWYPFDSCFNDIHAARPQARILMANFEKEFGYRIILKQMDWETDVNFLPPQIPADTHGNLIKSVEYAQSNQFDVVIYRTEEWPLAAVGEAVGAYRVANVYPGRVGGLLLLAVSPKDDKQPTKN